MKNNILKAYIVFAKFVGSFNSTLQTVFIVLKLLKLIDWSWWLVFAPMWAGIALAAPGMVYLWYLKRHLTQPAPDASRDAS